ncbi:hypothetical protein [Alteriqipengyuania sp. 357]
MIPDLPIPALDTAAGLARVAREGRWRPGLGAVAQVEIFASSREGSGAGAALALARDAWRCRARGEAEEAEDRRAVVWVQTRAAVKSGGRPFRPGLPQELRHRLIHVLVEKDEDALFALEEAVRCRDVAFVIGEIAGAARALDFTASRRLTLAAERHGVPLTLVRLDGTRDLSSARQRWAVQSAPSAKPQWNQQAPGVPAWQAELFRARSHPPGTWRLSEDGGKLVVERQIPFPVRGEDTKVWSRSGLAEVGEGRTEASNAASPSSGFASSFGASVAILSPNGERVLG